MQNQILGFFIISTIAFAGLSALQWKRSVNYREQTAASRQEAFEEARRAGMQEAEVRSLERRLEQRDQDTAALTEMVQSLMDSTNKLTLALSQARQVQETSANSSEEGSRSSPFGVLGKMFEDPAMQEVMRAQQRMMLDTMYGPLFQDLDLTEEETKAFKELLLESQMAGVKLGASAMSGDKAEHEAATEQLALEKESNEEMIRAFLGESGFAVYQDYQKTMGDRVLLNQFKSQLDGSRNSLGEDQFTQLVQIALDERRNSLPGIGDPSGDPRKAMEMLQSPEMQDLQLTRMEQTNLRVLERAQAFLSPEQVASLEEFQENQLKMMRLGMEMGRRMTQESGVQVSPVVNPSRAVPVVTIPVD